MTCLKPALKSRTPTAQNTEPFTNQGNELGAPVSRSCVQRHRAQTGQTNIRRTTAATYMATKLVFAPVAELEVEDRLLREGRPRRRHRYLKVFGL